jgi:NTE family protein
MLLSVALIGLLAGCGGDPVRPTPPPAPTVVPQAKPVKIGIALGGGAAKGFAHIGVIKMLEANGFEPAVVSGTSAGSVVGALYASGMDAFQMQSRQWRWTKPASATCACSPVAWCRARSCRTTSTSRSPTVRPSA